MVPFYQSACIRPGDAGGRSGAVHAPRVRLLTMPRLSEYLLPTEREPPADAEAISHKLLVRAGLIRQVGAGLWTWLPAGWRTHQRIVQIVREEMNAIGGMEMLMPIMQPAELWRRSGRYEVFGEELFKLKDRKHADMVLGPTSEEVVTTHAATMIRSYRDLPKILYHFQTKERDEPRPARGGAALARVRDEGLLQLRPRPRGPGRLLREARAAYDRIFDRCGLEWYRVEADVGAMGGFGADEYMAPCAAGENDVVLAPGYAANLEVASAQAQPVALPEASDAPEEVATPGMTTIAEVAAALGLPEGALLKAYPVVLEDGSFVLVMLRGDHKVNEIKLALALKSPFRQANAEEIEAQLGPPGFDRAGRRAGADPARRRGRSRCRAATSSAPTARTCICAASCPAATSTSSVATCATSSRGTPSAATRCGSSRRSRSATSSSSARATACRSARSYLDQTGASQLIWMGCYGIGPARIAAAAIEQFADDRGISWPRTIAPFDVHLVTLGKAGQRGARRLRPPLRGTPGSRPRHPLRRARRRPRREVRRRRAARLPAAGDGRPPDAAGRRDRGAGAPGPGFPRRPAGRRRIGDR